MRINKEFREWKLWLKNHNSDISKELYKETVFYDYLTMFFLVSAVLFFFGSIFAVSRYFMG